MKLDAKFHGVIVKNKNGTIVQPDEWIVFLAKDNAVPATLAFYQAECIRQGAAQEQVQAVNDLRLRVEAWRAAHADQCHVPDVHPGELR
jgi:hypothetical protein